MIVKGKDNGLVRVWLWSGVILVTIMVGIGGITRITGSGLSIVRWKVITGTIPPLSDVEWDAAFHEYQQTPQFKQINKTFTVTDFKEIYWWEYIHRLVARTIGLIFLIPYCAIMIGKKWSRLIKRQLTFILMLGMMQGVMGWLMVKSGLSDLPYVSHYRLAMHLGLALLLIAAILWTILGLNADSKEQTIKRIPYLFCITVLILHVQIILGAYVAGLKAGYYYNTFPLMGQTLVPENAFVSIHNGVLIQFLHRWTAFLAGGLMVFCWWKYRTHSVAVKKYLGVWLGLLAIQIVLGICTLVFAVPLALGVSHQLVAVALSAMSVVLVFYLRLRNEGYILERLG